MFGPVTITNFLILGLFIGAHDFHQEPEICSKIPLAFLLLIVESGFTLTYLAMFAVGFSMFSGSR